MSEFIEEQIVKRVVVGREGGNVLSVTNFSDRVEFSISNGTSTFPVSLTGPTFEALLDWMMKSGVSEYPRKPRSPISESAPESKFKNQQKKTQTPKMKAYTSSRSGVPRNPWTKDQIEQLVKRIVAGESPEQISIAISRSLLAIRDKRRAPEVVRMIEAARKQSDLLTPKPEMNDGS